MGGHIVTVKMKRAASGPERAPRYIRDELWHKVHMRIRFSLPAAKSKAAPYRAVLDDMSYLLPARRQWKAKEGELLFAFNDAHGMCHATSAVWAHWTSHALAALAKERKKDFAADYGIVLTVARPDPEVLYPYKGKLYVARPGVNKDFYLMGDGSDVESSKLPPAERAKVKKLVTSQKCTCPVCTYK